MQPQEIDQLRRIVLHDKLEKDLELIRQYEEGLAFRHDEVGRSQYEIGRLDERLAS
ncbi:hypothetical protein [Phytohabitans aurantiacus]|uniref:hypothetical protein n=1 Tax=Phytohabitans aurantiacus TaxID=3016789 RepID=UPI0024939923|nr:hypothetical protein [Phytohabitans aurantiacus]